MRSDERDERDESDECDDEFVSVCMYGTYLYSMVGTQHGVR